MHLHDAATSAIRGKGTYAAAQYARLKGRRGHAKALGAVQHSLLVSIYHMLQDDQPYHDLGSDYFLRHHNPQRRARHLIDELTSLGYTVTAEPPAA